MSWSRHLPLLVGRPSGGVGWRRWSVEAEAPRRSWARRLPGGASPRLLPGAACGREALAGGGVGGGGACPPRRVLERGAVLLAGPQGRGVGEGVGGGAGGALPLRPTPTPRASTPGPGGASPGSRAWGRGRRVLSRLGPRVGPGGAGPSPRELSASGQLFSGEVAQEGGAWGLRRVP